MSTEKLTEDKSEPVPTGSEFVVAFDIFVYEWRQSKKTKNWHFDIIDVIDNLIENTPLADWKIYEVEKKEAMIPLFKKTPVLSKLHNLLQDEKLRIIERLQKEQCSLPSGEYRELGKLFSSSVTTTTDTHAASSTVVTTTDTRAITTTTTTSSTTNTTTAETTTTDTASTPVVSVATTATTVTNATSDSVSSRGSTTFTYANVVKGRPSPPSPQASPAHSPREENQSVGAAGGRGSAHKYTTTRKQWNDQPSSPRKQPEKKSDDSNDSSYKPSSPRPGGGRGSSDST